MNTFRFRHIAAIFALSACALSARVGAQQANQSGVNDFATADRTFAHSAIIPLRRGEASTVTIVKDFIDLVSFNDVRLEGSGTLAVVGNGRINGGSGMGFLRVRITLGSTQAVGGTLNLKVGGGDTFRFRVTHRGLLTAVTHTPEPGTVTAGTPFITRVTGVDLGNAGLLAMPCHTITYANRSADAFSATVTRAGACTTTTFGSRVEPNGENDAISYVNASGNLVTFQVAYLPAGLACVSAPGLGAPTLRQPQQGQVFSFLPGTVGSVTIGFAWDSLTNTNVAAPNNEWILTRQSSGTTLSTDITSARIQADAAKTVRGLTTTFSVAVPDTYTFTLRAKNCGTNGPATTVQFSTRVQ